MRLLALLVLMVLAGGVLLVFSSYRGESDAPQRVWSAEHGHWHQGSGSGLRGSGFGGR